MKWAICRWNCSPNCCASSVEQEFERLGSNKLIQTDVRLIAATNRDLKQMVIDREFRSDLYYRLNVFPIHLPPLRERPDDIPLLVKAFTFKIARRMGRNIDSIPAETLRVWVAGQRARAGKRYRTGGIAHPRQRTAAPCRSGISWKPRGRRRS